MPLARQNFEELGLPAGPYTHAVRHGQTVYTSGFTAFGTPAQADSAGPQIKAVFAQLNTIAAHYGRSLKDLVKVTVFVTNMTDLPEIRSALAELYANEVPASSLVCVAALFHPQLRVEVEAIITT
ncbi:RidA family protein [Roseibium aggregatum]|uniref:RidA family protein n=1 Tax=Roseibium aggregatum TaxID=187304 RepID=UPI001E64B828|nr:RidA family protein [Roseibium aggregatum]UES58328.1 RidA family protein [Roseibium aggregatum]